MRCGSGRAFDVGPEGRAAWLPCGRSRGRGGRWGRPRSPPPATSAGDDQRAEARTVGRHHAVAPDSCCTPSTIATLPSTWITRAQAHHLVHVHEAGLEDGLGDHRSARAAITLSPPPTAPHVGREARHSVVLKLWGPELFRRLRGDAMPSWLAADFGGSASRSLVDLTAWRWSPRAHGAGAASPPRGRHGAQEGAGLDADRPPRRARSRAASRRPGCGCGWCRGPRSSRPCGSAISAGSTISGSCAAFSSTRLALGQRGGHQEVLGAGDRDHVGSDARALQARAPAGRRARP